MCIEIQQLTHEYKSGGRAVDSISLKVNQGEIFGFLGPNGAGKSTTVLMLTTLLPITAGHATVGGFDVKRQPEKVRTVIGAALQEVALDPLLTGREHLTFQAALYGLSRAETQKRGAELLARVGLEDAADRRAGAYSGGMKRRLDLALALLHRPRILFLDEPTTGLDPQSRKALWEEVERLARRDGVTVFLTTQYLEEADALADRIAIIDGGKIISEGTPAQLKQEIGQPRLEITPVNPRHLPGLYRLFERFGTPINNGDESAMVRLTNGADDIGRILGIMANGGVEIAQMQLHHPTLDDVFLAKTGRKPEGMGEEREEKS